MGTEFAGPDVEARTQAAINLVACSVTSEAQATLGVNPRREAEKAVRGADGEVNLARPFASGGGTRILEIGAGVGLGLISLISEGYDAMAVEPSVGPYFNGRAEVVRNLADLHGIRLSGRFIQATGQSLPLKDGSIDVVLSVAVLEHVDDLPGLLVDCGRVLKADGIFLADIPNYWYWRETHYGCAWLPVLSLSPTLAELWIANVVRKDPSYVRTLNLLTWGKIRTLSRNSSLRLRSIPQMTGPLARLSGLLLALQPEYKSNRKTIRLLKRRPWLASLVRAGLSLSVGACYVSGICPTIIVVGTPYKTSRWSSSLD